MLNYQRVQYKALDLYVFILQEQEHTDAIERMPQYEAGDASVSKQNI